jgi:prevent-host-death family protein
MAEVGAYEAKTKLSELLERVARGERIVITKHGIPVAILAPVVPQTDPQKVVAELKAFRKGKTLKPLKLEEAIKERRRSR